PRAGRARGRGPVPQARLDPALAPADLPRTADLPRPQAGLRRLPGGRPVPLVRRGGDRPREGAQAAEVRACRGGARVSRRGQVSFPGGGQDPSDGGPVDAALREAREETGLDPRGVDVLGQLPPLYLPPSGFVVTPVLGWWRTPSPVRVVDPAEVAAVVRVPLR